MGLSVDRERPLAGRAALVTGGAGAIGRDIALALAEAGAGVALADLRLDLAADVASRVAGEVTSRVQATGEMQAGAQVIALGGDISRPEDCAAMAEVTVGRLGGLDILVHAAGITSRVPSFLELTPERFRQTLRVNLTGTFLMAQAVLPYMKARGGGRIVIISSASGLTGSGGGAHYAASKSGQNSLVRALAREVAPFGITVNAVAPRVIRSEMLDALYPDATARNRLAETIPVRRIGTPRDVAEAAVYFSSDVSSYVTGQVLIVDGGRTFGT